MSDLSPKCAIFKGDSDAHIVRGLIAIVFATGRCADEILRTDPQGVSGWPST
jgi:sulfur transfer protein SufE